MNKEKVFALCKSLFWGICILLFPILSGILSVVFSLGTIEMLFLQGTFMLLALTIPIFFVLAKKWRWSEIGFAKIDISECKKVLYFLPVSVVFIPTAVKGFCIKSTAYVLGNLFLYLMVGIAEEIYFRGIIPKYLNKAFSLKGVILYSTIIFGIGHMTTAFTTNNGLEIFLTVLNAFIFGWLAIEMTVISKNITPVILLHFMFDFETKIVVMHGTDLLIAECIRGIIMFVVSIWLSGLANGNKRILREYSHKGRTKKMIITIVSIFLCAVFVLGSVMFYVKYQMSKIPELTFEEALEYTTKDDPNAVITVGIIKDGELSYKVYGENGKEISPELHTYEIGSLTKTFTAALINKASTEGKLDLDNTIDYYLSLPKGNEYPTIKELLTHTSGYKGYYFENQMISNFFKGRNDFYGITKNMVLDKAKDLNMDNENYEFNYSNFGYAILGLVLEVVYDSDYTTIVNDFAQNELGLKDTRISDKSGDLGNYWDWKEDDAYLSAGAITSNISDMLSYAQMQLDSNPYFDECHESMKIINASNKDYKMMGINMDEIGMSWIIDEENGIIWHNGGTGGYNSYLGFNLKTETAVIILANLSPNYRIPATVLGIKLLVEMDN